MLWSLRQLKDPIDFNLQRGELAISIYKAFDCTIQEAFARLSATRQRSIYYVFFFGKGTARHKARPKTRGREDEAA